MNVTFSDSFTFNPYYIINDNIFEIMRYFFGVSLYVNNIRKEVSNKFNLSLIVIGKSVKCVFGEEIKFEYDMGKITDYLNKYNTYGVKYIMLK